MATANAMFTITDVDDLNGRNLIQRSFFTKEPWTGPTYNAVGDGFGVYHGKYCLPIRTGYIYRNTNKGFNNAYPDLTFQPNTQYTVSGKWAQFRNDNSFNRLYIKFWYSDGTTDFIRQPDVNNEWTEFKFTSDAGKTVTAITHTFSSDSWTYVADYKLEIGDAATDWTPAPEDVNTALDDAKEAKELANTKNSVYYQTSAPTGNLKDGDTWFDTDNDYKISRWNAGTQEWAAAELGNQAIGNLNASHINAGTLTAVDIEAGKAQDIAGTIKVYDENNAVKVGLDKDGLVATKGKIGNWDISSYSIEYQEDIPSSEDTVIGGDEDEQLIESGTPTLVGGATLKLKICTYDPDNPNLGPHIISSVVENGVAPQNDNGKTMRISNGGLACYYNRNNSVTGGSVSINPKLINVINADYDEDQVLWTDSANLNPGSLTIMMSKTENGEQTSVGRSFLTYRDLSFLGDSANPQLASGIAHWSVLAARRTIKDELGVTIYHCGNLFWAHFDGKMTVGWKSRMEEYISIVPNDDANFTNSKLCAPPNVLEKYCMPQSPANPRAIYRVFPDGQLGLYHFIPPTNGTNNYEVLTYDNWEPCDIFWAHIG